MKKLPSRGAKGLRRSLHFVPGGNDRMFEKALKLPADSLILDLEDSVTPSNKKAARDEVCNWIKEIDFENQECLVRINPLDTSWGLDDLQAVVEALPDGIVLPKVAKKKDVMKIDSIVGDVERQKQIEEGSISFVLIGTEVPEAVFNPTKWQKYLGSMQLPRVQRIYLEHSEQKPNAIQKETIWRYSHMYVLLVCLQRLRETQTQLMRYMLILKTQMD